VRHIDTPDNSTISCASANVVAGTNVTCTVTPQRGAEQIFATLLYLQVSDGGANGTFASISASPANSYTAVYTAPATTGPVTLSVQDDGVVSGTFSLTVLSVPDGSVLSCQQDNSRVSSNVTCNFTAQEKGADIFTTLAEFSVTADNGGSILDLGPSVEKDFSFVVQAGSSTGPMTVTVNTTTNGNLSTFSIIVTGKSAHVGLEPGLNALAYQLRQTSLLERQYRACLATFVSPMCRPAPSHRETTVAVRSTLWQATCL